MYCEECGEDDDGICLNCSKAIQKNHQAQCDNRKGNSAHSHLNCKYPTLEPRELHEKGYGETQDVTKK